MWIPLVVHSYRQGGKPPISLIQEPTQDTSIGVHLNHSNEKERQRSPVRLHWKGMARAKSMKPCA